MSANNSASRRAKRRREAILTNPTAAVLAHLMARIDGRANERTDR